MTMNRFRCRSRQTIYHQEHKFNNNFQQNDHVINDEFALECLRSHNHFRAQHGCPPLHLSAEVSRFSQEWADQISGMDQLHHSYNSHYGENLFVTYMSDISIPLTTGNQVVETWYSEHRFYPYNGYVTRETVGKAGHFSQVVWSSSRELGIGKSVSKSNRVYVVANYYPAGNIMNKFSFNVPQKIFSYCERHYSRMLTKTNDFCHEYRFGNWIEC